MNFKKVNYPVIVFTAWSLFGNTALVKAQETTVPKSETVVQVHNEQQDTHAKNRIGVQVGPNISSAVGDVGGKSRFRLAAGIAYERELTPVLSLRPELNFVQKGLKIADYSGLDANLNLNYLEIPLLLRVNFSQASAVRQFLLIGPKVSFLTSSSVSVDYKGQNIASIPVSDLLEKIAFGFSVGGGLEFEISKDLSGTIGSRFSMDITNSAKPELADEGLSYRNWGVELLAGVNFNLL